jgi:hypothetical protein
MGHYNSFLVKIWADDNEKLVRGQIQHVGTKELVYFRTWKKMINFISGRLDMNGGDDIDKGAESRTPGKIDGQ